MEKYLELSYKQTLIYEFICEYLDQNGISPTIEDVKIGCNISSKSVVSYNLDILEKKGLLDRRKGVARSIIRSNEESESFSVPIVSTISAGIPLDLLSTDEIAYNSSFGEERVSLSKSMFNNNNKLLALRIMGDSMIEDSIEDGDIIIIDCTNNNSYKPRQGDIVVARVEEDTATLKRIYKNGNKVELRPSNKRYSSIITKNNNVIIEGKVVGLIRNYLN
ncbi:MAG: repressor LexA [Chloroflexi bacterium]|nr:repressor LexA [Chloroflexota bacterium]|tara:strand:- start:6433 stop:7092 length:660 start_codon:yes stop_codon:yes gene_type:complete